MCRLTPTTFTLLTLCGITAVQTPSLAQQGKVTITNPATAQPEPRPAPDALRVPAVDPKLEAVLIEWHQKTQNIQKLQGQHRRWMFEPVFQVAKVSSGMFYFEAPDRGRIDLVSDENALAGVDIDPTKDGIQIIQPGNPNVVFTVKPDKGERWICDGTQILKFDESEKTCEIVPIPAEHRGKNIMDGPLPFLFGLPPDKAKKRYDMTLHASPKPNTIFLEVHPLQHGDASLWQKADVLLDATTYLPLAVKLLDNKGQGTTLYSFSDHKINATSIVQKLFGAGDPFKPSMHGYKQVQGPGPPAQPAGAIQQTAGEATAVPQIPSVIGLGHTEATKALKRQGYANIKFALGPLTKDPALRWQVVDQTVQRSANAAAGDTIFLKLYVFEEDVQKFQAGVQKSAQKTE